MDLEFTKLSKPDLNMVSGRKESVSSGLMPRLYKKFNAVKKTSDISLRSLNINKCNVMDHLRNQNILIRKYMNWNRDFKLRLITNLIVRIFQIKNKILVLEDKEETWAPQQQGLHNKQLLVNQTKKQLIEFGN